MSDFIMSLSDTSTGLLQVGGKGASLARLAAAGLPVPDGFHVTTAVYELFVVVNNLRSEITGALTDIASTQPAKLEVAALRIRTTFEASKILAPSLPRSPRPMPL